MFTPTNITRNCVFVQAECRVYPVISGNQWTKPAMIAKTAPIDKT